MYSCLPLLLDESQCQDKAWWSYNVKLFSRQQQITIRSTFVWVAVTYEYQKCQCWTERLNVVQLEVEVNPMPILLSVFQKPPNTSAIAVLSCTFGNSTRCSHLSLLHNPTSRFRCHITSEMSQIVAKNSIQYMVYSTQWLFSLKLANHYTRSLNKSATAF